MTTVEGACLCGAVRFQVALPPKWVAHCHCSMCRRAHGAPYVTWIGLEETEHHQGLTITAGADAVKTYRSSDAGQRQFCGVCGSPLFFRSSRWAGEVHVARAAIPGDIGKGPAVHAFFSDKAPWVHVADGLPRRGGLTGVEPLPAPAVEVSPRDDAS